MAEEILDLRKIKDPMFQFVLRNGEQKEVDPFEIQEKMQSVSPPGASQFDGIRSAFGLLTKAEYDKAKKSHDNFALDGNTGDPPTPPYLATRNEAMELWYGVQAFIANLESTKKHLGLMQKSLAALQSPPANG